MVMRVINMKFNRIQISSLNPSSLWVVMSAVLQAVFFGVYLFNIPQR